MSDRDVERLICGKSPENKALRPLAPMLGAFRHITWPAPTDEAIAAFASAAATMTRSATLRTTLTPSPPARSRFLAPALQRGFATGLASVLFVSGLAGVAVASDDSAPGDLLYGLDRALESIGVGAGGASERISEARALLEGGQIDEAVGHAFQAVDDLITEPPSAQLLEEIAGMLGDPTIDGKDFGQSVAEMARLLGANDDSLSGPGQSGKGGSTPGELGPGQPEPGPPGPGEPGPSQPGPGQSGPGQPAPGQSRPGNSGEALTPPSGNLPGQPNDDPPPAPSNPPGKSGEAPGKTESSPGKSDEKQTIPPTRP